MPCQAKTLTLTALLLLALAGCVGVSGDANAPPGTPESGLPAVETGNPNPGTPGPGPGPGPVTPQNKPPEVAGLAVDVLTGEAPLKVTFRFKGTDPEAAPLRCELDADGDAKPDADGDCTAEQEYLHTFSTPGLFTAKLTVKDDKGLTAERTLSIEVKEKPNQPPVVSAFSATPASGGVPLATTFTFTASDPDGEALTCTLDVQGDGTPEYTPTNCASGTQAHSYPTAGTFEAVLTVKDARGLTAQRKVTLTARMPVGDVRISKAEWGQSVFKTDLRLVEGKAAMLRVYVLADRAGLAGVTVRAEALQNGTVLGAIPLTGPATPPTAESTDLAQSYRGVVSEAFVTPGVEVRITADPSDALPETNETNNELRITPVVGTGNVLHTTPVPVVHQGTTATIPAFEGAMLRLWPIKQVTRTVRAPYTFAGTLTANDGNAWSTLLQNIAAVRTSDASQRYYYGFVRITYNAGIFGIGYVGQPAATGADSSVQTYAHEVGHNMGRPHAPCGNPANPDPQYPYAGARLGTYGYDSAGAQPAAMLKVPTANFDLMSYCDPAWVSDYNYNRVQVFLEANPPRVNVVAGDDQPLMMVTGRLTPQGLVLSPLQRFVGRASQPERTDVVLGLVTADGARHVFGAQLLEVSEGGEHHFVAAVPDVGPLVRVEVEKDGALIGSRKAGPPAPFDAKLAEKPGALEVTWDAAAHPWAMVAHVGQGGERTTLALWLTGGHAVLPLADLPDGGGWDVSLSDGVNAARASLPRR